MIEEVEFQEYYVVPEIIGNLFSEDKLEEMVNTMASNYIPRLSHNTKAKELKECDATVVLYPFERSCYRWILPIYCKQKALIKAKKECLRLFLIDVHEHYVTYTYKSKILVSKDMNGILFCNGKDINIYSVNYVVNNCGAIAEGEEAKNKFVKDLEKVNELYESTS